MPNSGQGAGCYKEREVNIGRLIVQHDAVQESIRRAVFGLLSCCPKKKVLMTVDSLRQNLRIMRESSLRNLEDCEHDSAVIGECRRSKASSAACPISSTTP